MIKPIETVYKGYRFRSRLEARWAVFFDALGIEWEYEKEGYDLGEAGWYLPDFWLPRYHIHCEIKPVESTKQDDERLAQIIWAMTQKPGMPLMLLRGVPGEKMSTLFLPTRYGWRAFCVGALISCTPPYGLGMLSPYGGLRRADEFSSEDARDLVAESPVIWLDFAKPHVQSTEDAPETIPDAMHGAWDRVTDAGNKARAARFEHGEHGGFAR